jgi:hypothetical protein
VGWGGVNPKHIWTKKTLCLVVLKVNTMSITVLCLETALIKPILVASIQIWLFDYNPHWRVQ